LQKIDAVLESLSVESAMDLQKVLRISTVISRKDAFNILWANVPLFESRLGAMLFLISALFSRGLVCLCTLVKFSIFCGLCRMHMLISVCLSKHRDLVETLGICSAY
jgi:hypothetical protein